MQPQYESGDIVAIRLIDHWQEWITYGHVYVIVTKEEQIVRVIRKGVINPDTHFTIHSFNSEEHSDFELPKSHILSIFRVLGSLRFSSL